MKKLLCIIVPVLLTISSCKKVDELTEFDLHYSTSITLPASALDTSGSVSFLSPDIPTGSASQFSSHGTARHLIDEIKLTALTVNSETGNLDFLSSFSVYMKAAGTDEVLIATCPSIPPGAKSVSADPSGENIKELIFNDNIQLRLVVNITSLPSEEQRLGLAQTVHVAGKKLSK